MNWGMQDFFKAIAAQLPVDDAVREDIRQYIEAKNYAALDMVLGQIGRKQVSQCNASFAAFVWRGRDSKRGGRILCRPCFC